MAAVEQGQQQADEVDETEDEHQQGAQGGQGEESGRDALGDKGKLALDRMKTERNQLREQLNQFKGLGLPADKLRELIGKSEESAKAAEQERVRREAESAALSKANERLIRAEIKAAATGKLANPALALRLLDVSAFDVDDDGEVDSSAITSAIEDLIKKEPYLAAGETPRFQGTADGGSRGTAGKPQLTESDVKKLYADKKYTEIEQARTEGRLDRVLGITK